ncbi:Proline 4-hydroxylase (includes Rps23 Pro-64 3,4-dihydroxylase Tpa1), contains SM-20 domain [Ruegeria halocynthiae]|uniref:Proline 4-hydroxylase (Includes Rps23 Pro-64 3,4-dihydroxylase Tpa1), contains SM-20 domain n=1 Tax=Ruegeria halocynthiae TaxID=985054 RepID=A0A1H2Y301_9RHOB|nr:2OG-Fe(II) oxygenase [Ruegeria halocynthiae]SDW98959.1 Proline 4-hydroxylase (includes Rps23 Pro-64 3,4-dihydroxylase Tpa1), contains SM-20 domain [Ruegeria halocynthiae]
MNKVVYPLNPETLLISSAEARKAAEPFAETYQNEQPYPHGSYDDFLPPEILERVKEELESLPEAESSFDRVQEKLKTSYIPERLPPYTRQLFYALNSRPFLAFLEELTGIDGLIPDPYFMGAGVHVVANGGHLDIHADFNHHGKMNLERRLNILIYLNKDWQQDWGGSFEVWEKDMSRKVKSFVPLFNRMACFNTSSESWHGNPETVNSPTGEPRMSIALYYYTATWDETRKSHSTLFKPRPGTADQHDKIEARHAILKDLLPPVLYRRLAYRLRKIGI